MDSANTLKPYSGYRKLQRVYFGLDKALKVLGNSIDLFTADFHAIEKLAGIIQLEKHLRKRVEENYGNPEAQAFMYKLLLLISDRKPSVKGYLTKARLFEISNNSWEGRRLIQKSNLRNLMKGAFPHCFRYDAEDVNDVKMGKLVSIMNFNPPVVEYSPPSEESNIYSSASELISSSSFKYAVLFGLLSFVSGSVYGYILFKGLKGT
jgi:hypothetical protein